MEFYTVGAKANFLLPDLARWPGLSDFCAFGDLEFGHLREAPKVRDTIAQGNALGFTITQNKAL